MNFVYIGRFQPIHNGHMAIIEKTIKMMKENDSFTIIIGSADQERTIRNPLTVEERRKTLEIATEGMSVKIDTINDSPYDYDEWIRQLAAKLFKDYSAFGNTTIVGMEGVEEYVKRLKNVDWRDACKSILGIEGVEEYVKRLKDITGRDACKSIVFTEQDTNTNIHSTKIREMPEIFFNEQCTPVYEYLKDIGFTDIIKNINKVADDYAKSCNVKYNTCFMTVDNVVCIDDKVLLIRRKDNGKYAIPGGFAEPCQTMKQNALRELEEETGLTEKDVVFKKEPILIDAPFRDPRSSKKVNLTSMVYSWNCKNPDNVKAADDAADAMWVDFKEIENMKTSEFHADHKKIICKVLGINYFKV